jgi:hypothetical protein
VFEGKTHQVISEPPRATRLSYEVTQRVASSWRIRRPIEGTRYPQASYLSPDQEVSFKPFMWSSIKSSRFSAGIAWERLTKPSGPDLIGAGGICPCPILWRGTGPGWLSPTNSDLGSTQILTQHYSAQSQTVSLLESSVTTLTSKFL